MVQSNQSNMRYRQKASQQEQTFLLQCSSFFLRTSVSSLLIERLCSVFALISVIDETRVVHGPEPGTSFSRILSFFFEPERFGINFFFTVTGIPKSQINFVHERFFAVNRAVLK